MTGTHPAQRGEANRRTVERLLEADPVLVDVRPAIEVVPGMATNMILTSGPSHAFDEYTGPQRDAILYAAVHEGLAPDAAGAEEAMRSGDIVVEPTSWHATAGSSCGVHSASTPVLVVENRAGGNRSFCGLYEAKARRLLSYGIYDRTIADRLRHLCDTVGPTLSRALQATGGVRLRPLIARALRMGDELHSRTLAATTLLLRELALPLFDLDDTGAARQTLQYLTDTEPLFLRVSLAAAKATADAAHGVPASSIVTGMIMSCNAFAIRVGGLDDWITSELPPPVGAFFEGFGPDDVVWSGGESTMIETVGLGAFAQTSAFALLQYQGGDPDRMRVTNEQMYDITLAEHPEFAIPFLAFRGVPVGIDVFRVVDTGITPGLDIGYTGGSGVGQIGAGMARAPYPCFAAAARTYHSRYEGGGGPWPRDP